jgi:uncharacterized protein (TIGR04222 family)
MDEMLQAKWRAIEAFALDDPGAALPFSRRLARDKAWSLPFTQRAIREYKRFVFLALHAGHPVTPSEAVDEVWHEHLTYTRSYWERFCGEILGRPLHHEPTRGGQQERERYHGQYERTLAAYEQLFGEKPPADIWPVAKVRFRRNQATMLVQAGRYWLVRKPPRDIGKVVVLSAVSLALAGCAALKQVWPWSLNGGQFLQLYFWLLAGGLCVAWLLRWRLRKTPTRTPPLTGNEADMYLQAYVAGRERRVLFAALTRCLDAECVAVSTVGSTPMVRISKPAPDSLHPVETALIDELTRAGGQLSLSELEARLEPVLQPLADEALARDWILQQGAQSNAWLWPLVIGLGPLILGASRVWQGLEAGRPVGFLVIMMIVGGFAFLATLVRRPWLTLHGQSQLKTWRAEKIRLKHYANNPGYEAAEMGGPGMSVALFGVGALSGMMIYQDFVQTLRPMQTTTGAGDTGCGTVDSGGSSGGDSGGGGCGSGCGGCGGGD